MVAKREEKTTMKVMGELFCAGVAATCSATDRAVAKKAWQAADTNTTLSKATA